MDINASSKREPESVGRDLGRLRDYGYLQAYLQEYIMDTTGWDRPYKRQCSPRYEAVNGAKAKGK